MDEPAIQRTQEIASKITELGTIDTYNDFRKKINEILHDLNKRIDHIEWTIEQEPKIHKE